MSDLDPTDPYDAASVWCCFFICDSCNFDLEFASPHQRGLLYYHDQGQAARRGGWYVEVQPGDRPQLLILCPNCARKAGKGPQDVESLHTPTSALLTICRLTARPGESASQQ